MTKEKVTKAPLLFDQPTAMVGVKGGLTINLGNYSSLRVDVSLTMPCYVTELEEVFAFTHGWVDEKLEGIHEGVQKSGMVTDEG